MTNQQKMSSDLKTEVKKISSISWTIPFGLTLSARCEIVTFFSVFSSVYSAILTKLRKLAGKIFGLLHEFWTTTECFKAFPNVRGCCHIYSDKVLFFIHLKI